MISLELVLLCQNILAVLISYFLVSKSTDKITAFKSKIDFFLNSKAVQKASTLLLFSTGLTFSLTLKHASPPYQTPIYIIDLVFFVVFFRIIVRGFYNYLTTERN